MAIHAVHRLERHHLGSSQAAARAMDSVAQQEWEHPQESPAAAAAAEGGDGLAAMQAQLVAARQQQEQGQGGQQQGEQQAGQPTGQPTDDCSSGSSSSNVIKVIALFPFLQGMCSLARLRPGFPPRVPSSCLGAASLIASVALPPQPTACMISSSRGCLVASLPPSAAAQWTPTAAASVACSASPRTTPC